MRIAIEPGKPAGTVAAPASKSAAQRLLIRALLAGGGRISGISESEDILAALDCAAALGALIRREGDTVLLEGYRSRADEKVVLPCRESAAALRFFLPVGTLFADSVLLTGSPGLLRRGAGVYGTALAAHGLKITEGPDGIRTEGKLQAGYYEIPGNISSQYATGLLMTLPVLPGDSALRILPPVESRPYIDLTLEIIRRGGIVIRESAPGVFEIPGGQRFLPPDETVEGDWSAAAVLMAFGLGEGSVTVTGLREDSTQGDRVCAAALEELERRELRMDLSDCPDLAPILFAASAAYHGGIFTGTRRLAGKESDRARVMAKEMAAFGIRVQAEEDRVTVLPGALKRPAEPLNAHGDHRVVMALSYLCSLTGGEIDGAEAVRKSYPGFFRDLFSLGIPLREIPAEEI